MGRALMPSTGSFSAPPRTSPSYGIDNTPSSTGTVYRAIGGAWLKKGEAKIGAITLTPGIEYVVIAASDEGVKKVSLQILDAKRKPNAKDGDEVITESSEDSNAPGCTVNLDKAKYGTKPYALGARMVVESTNDDADNQSRPGGWVCFIVLQKEAGLRIPADRFTEALRNLDTRLSALALKNSGNAGVASDSIAISGAVLRSQCVREPGLQPRHQQEVPADRGRRKPCRRAHHRAGWQPHRTRRQPGH